MKRIIALITILAMLVTFCSCSKRSDSEIEGTDIEIPSESNALPVVEDMFTSRDSDASYSESGSTSIVFSNGSAAISGSGATAVGGVVTISSDGSYIVSGSITDGQLVVNVDSTAKPQLVFDGVSITNSDGAAFYVVSADKVFVTLVGSNSLTTSGTFVQTDDNNVDGALFSKDDLTINGEGSLTVSCSSGHGVVVKDDFVIIGSSVTINSGAGHAIDANDSVRLSDATLSVTADNDGVHCENEDDSTLGYIYMENTNYTAVVDGDGMDSSQSIQINGGNYSITSAGGSSNSSSSGSGIWGYYTTSSSVSAKGIKATDSLIIYGGTITINSSDDALHSNNGMEIDGGTISISSGDDGIHADGTVLIVGGSIDITKSYEGLEGQNVTLEGGTVSIVASDDGINASGGNDSSSTMARPGQNSFNTSSNAFIYIKGGNLTINATGDGVDANGALYVSGGTTIVYGPTSSGNGALDYDGTAQITGGVFIAFGSSGMACNFNSASQGTILYNYSTSYSAGTEFKLCDSSGNVLLTQTSKKAYNSIVVSCPSISSGSSYKLYSGTGYVSVSMSSTIYGSSSGMGGSTMPGGSRR